MMKLYGWAIEFGDGHVAFFRADRHDRAYVDKRAADLHGVIVALYAQDERR